MKALVIDTAISCITVAAKNNDALASLTLDIGMRQSEKLLPAIDYVLTQVGLEAADLDYTALTAGPGSFTGLRLGFAALKAIEAAHGVPVYAINTLDYYAAPFKDFDGIVLSVVDAHKGKFYAKAFLRGEEIIPCDDYELRTLVACLQGTGVRGKGTGTGNRQQATVAGSEQQEDGAAEKIFVAGLEARAFVEACTRENLLSDKKLFCTSGRVVNLESLFLLAEEKIAKKEPPLKEYDGPEYFRASEAELNSSRRQ